MTPGQRIFRTKPYRRQMVPGWCVFRRRDNGWESMIGHYTAAGIFEPSIRRLSRIEVPPEIAGEVERWNYCRDRILDQLGR